MSKDLIDSIAPQLAVPVKRVAPNAAQAAGDGAEFSAVTITIVIVIVLI